MHPRTGRQRAYWACAGRLEKAVTAPAAMTISTDWRMACSLEVFRATLMYERVHAPFKAPDSGNDWPRDAGRRRSLLGAPFEGLAVTYITPPLGPHARALVDCD